MLFFSRKIHHDQHGKATSFCLYSLAQPYMRAFHMAWLSFMVAFFGWYSIPPLITYIASDLNIPPDQVYDSNVVAVCATILGHFTVGPFCERFGPRRVMATLLLLGSVPCALTGLIQNGSGLIALRVFVGILGATFSPCQFWMTQMFSPSIVGTANAITAGWGDMGAGVAYFVMPAIYGGVRHYLPVSKAWRVVYVIPASMCIIAAIATLLFSTDTPHGDWFRTKGDSEKGEPSEKAIPDEVDVASPSKDKDSKKNNAVTAEIVVADEESIAEVESIADVKRNESALAAFLNFFKVLAKPPVLIMIGAYACSLGIQLAIDNVIGQVFEVKFRLDPSRSSYIGSIFGLLNICSRLSGGLFSDFMGQRYHIPGRILALLIGMVLEGIFLISFSFGLVSLTTSIILMVFFSFFVQAVCGLTYGIVPFIDPLNNGKVMGIVGAGGNFGGLVFNLMFRGFGTRYEPAFLCLGCVCLGVAMIGCALLHVQNKTVWHLHGGQYL